MIEFEKRNYLIFDIETIPMQDAEKPEMQEDYVKYGNAKDEVKRKIIYNNALLKWNEGLDKKMSLSGELCQIISIAYIIADQNLNVIEENVLFDQIDDQYIVFKFVELIKTNNYILCGFNSKAFDITVAWKRAIMNNVQFPINLYLNLVKKYDTKNHIDLMQLWNNYERGSLKNCCKALNISCKTGLDGSQVYDAFKQERFEEIKEYNLEDCQVCLEIMKRLGYADSNAF